MCLSRLPFGHWFAVPEIFGRSAGRPPKISTAVPRRGKASGGQFCLFGKIVIWILAAPSPRTSIACAGSLFIFLHPHLGGGERALPTSYAHRAHNPENGGAARFFQIAKKHSHRMVTVFYSGKLHRKRYLLFFPEQGFYFIENSFLRRRFRIRLA